MGALGRIQDPFVEKEIAHHVVHRDHTKKARTEIRRGNDDVGRGCFERFAADGHAGAHRTIAGVVVPPVIVGEGRGGRSGHQRLGQSPPAEKQQTALFVRPKLPKVDRLAEKCAVIKRHAACVRARYATRRRADAEPRAVVAIEIRVALWRFEHLIRRQVHAVLEGVPPSLEVRHFDAPVDLRGVCRHLDGVAVPERCVDAKPRDLPLDPASAVAITVGVLRRLADDFGSEEIPVGRIADARDADGGMDGQALNVVGVHERTFRKSFFEIAPQGAPETESNTIFTLSEKCLLR